MEHATDAGAGAFIVSPLWLQTLQTGHAVLDGLYACAQFLLPFAGLAWLSMQMYHKHKQENK
jgi:hypothetical protein